MEALTTACAPAISDGDCEAAGYRQWNITRSQTFLAEAEELISSIEQAALSLGGGESLAEAVNQIFRAFHTIKGSAAMCGLLQVSGFTHHVETLLERVREGTVAVSPELSDLVLAAADQIELLLAVEQGGKPVAADSNQRLIDKISELSDAPVGPFVPRLAFPSAKRNVSGKERSERGGFASTRAPVFSRVAAIRFFFSGSSPG